MSELGRLAKVGDTVDIEAGTFRVERMDGRRIDRVRFTPRHDDASAAPETTTPGNGAPS